MSEIENETASPTRRVVIVDDGPLTEGALAAVVARVESVALLGSSADSELPAMLERLGLTTVAESGTGADMRGAITYASTHGIGAVLTGPPRKPEDWMRSVLEGVADVAGAQGTVPVVHVLSSGASPNGPILLATTTGEVARRDATVAVDYASLLGHDLEVITPIGSDEDADIRTAGQHAKRLGVRFTHEAVAEPATTVIVRAAAISAVVLAVFDVEGKLRAGSKVTRKTLGDGQVREVIDTLSATPPHDVIVLFHAARMTGGDDSDDQQSLTDGAPRVP